MGMKQLERIAHETIVETQEESEKDDEIIFKLIIDGKMVSWAKTTLYSNLDDLHTACLDKRKGYGKKLLAYVEKNARDHCATSIKTCNFNIRNDEAINFFKRMCYVINSSTTALNGSVNGKKIIK